MTGRIPARALKLAAASFGATALLAVAAGAAGATSEVIYNNLPAVVPGNLPSLGFEATSTSEFGGMVEFAGTDRRNPTVTIGMSTWACESGSWTGTPECVTAKGATFEWPITVNIYEVGPGNTVGPLIKAVTKTFRMPYRPSQNNLKCKGGSLGGWYDMGPKQCFHGKFFKIVLMVSKVKLTAKVIVTVAYNTSDYGAVPQRPKACNATSGGCPYDSLNVATTEPVNEENPEPVAPSIGTDPLPEDAYLSSTWGGAYCDGGASGTGALRLDTGCWTGYQPTIKVKASS